MDNNDDAKLQYPCIVLFSLREPHAHDVAITPHAFDGSINFWSLDAIGSSIERYLSDPDAFA